MINMSEWIKCSDRLPKEGQRVIYYFEHTGIDIGKYNKTTDMEEVIGFEMDCFHGGC